MRIIRGKTTRWAAAIFFASCWSYAMVARFTEFFMASRQDKLTILGAAIGAAGLFSVFIFQFLLPKIINQIPPKTALKIVLLSTLAAAVLLLFIFQPLYFPEHHLLEIMPQLSSGGNDLTIISIHRIELPGGEKLLVSPSLLDLQGSWNVDSGSNTITWTGDPESKISYARLMQAGIEILFKAGPDQGTVRILWDGHERLLNLYAPVEGMQSIQLMPALDFFRADLTRKILVGVAMAAEFLVLSAIISITVLFPKVFPIRNPKTLIVCAAVLLLLVPLVNAADPPVQFQDPHLEGAVREILDQPDGAIRQHKLLTIAKLDVSSSEIVNLDGIQYLRKLADLNLRDNHIIDITHISQLTHLRGLNLRGNAINDITPLTTLAKLESLDLRENRITDIESLRYLHTLEVLNLRDNEIQDLEPIAELTGLKYLNIHSNPIDSGFKVLSNLENLQSLIMRNVNIGDNIRFLVNLTNLQQLNARNSSISDVSFIANIMGKGALQDCTGNSASINLLDNNISGDETDAYAPIRPYWDNITYRYPINLPYFPSQIEQPLFSHLSGFYEEGFYLALSTDQPGGKIYYTLDGTEPSPSSKNQINNSTKKYASPIKIKSGAGKPNLLSNIETSQPGLHVYRPTSEVFKASVVRAAVIDKDGNKSDVVTHTYFVDEHIQDRYTLPVVAFSTDPDGLFDDEIGIYVPGNLFEDIESSPGFNPANYAQRGLKWERPVYFQMFNQSGEVLIAQNVGIRIHGEGTRWVAQKSLRLYAGEEFDPQKIIHFGFFPALNNRLSNKTVDTFKTLVIRNSGQDWDITFFKDAMAQSLLEYTKLDIMGYQPVIVFINGEYWGIHNVRTRYDEYYFQSYYGMSKDEIAMLASNSVLKIGSMDDVSQYENVLKLIDHDYRSNGYQTVSTLSDPNTYKKVTELIDINNFIDLYVSQIYFGNADWPGNNIYFWRKKVEKQLNASDIPYGHDGKWRWMVLDSDLGFEDPSYNNLFEATRDDGTAWYNEPWSTFLVRSLLENHDFKMAFINRFSDHLNTTFREDAVIDKINQFEELLLPEIEEHIHRWCTMGGSPEAWQANVEEMRKFALLRHAFQRQHIIEYFGLSGTARITLQTNSDRGYIRINFTNITPDTPGVTDADHWEGIYFQGIPISLSAIPNPGYQFEGWEGIDQSEAIVQLILVKDLKVTAKFIPIEE